MKNTLPQDIPIGEEFTDIEGKIWLRVSENVYTENTPITIEEALKDKESIRSLIQIARILGDLR